MTDLFSTPTPTPITAPSLTGPITILKCRLAEFEEQFAKLKKRGAKYGQPMSYTLANERTEERRVASSHGETKVTVTVLDVVVVGEAPRVPGHTFMARIELGDDGRNMVNHVPSQGEEMPARFRTTDSHCDHCGHDRRRRDVYVLREDETGEYRQIGRTCLREYLGTDTPEKLAWRMAWFRQLRDETDGWGWQPSMMALTDVLVATAAVIRVEGWVSRGRAYETEECPTASHVADVFSWDLKTRSAAQKAFATTDADQAMAEGTLAWVREEIAGREQPSDYEWNLTVAMSDDAVSGARLGLVCSAVAGYQRTLDRAREDEAKEARAKARGEADAKSEWVGQPGERLRGVKATLEMSRVIGEGYGYHDDPRRLLKLRTSDGSLLTWFTSAAEHLEEGADLVIDLTVKEHSEYNGARETLITRARVH